MPTPRQDESRNDFMERCMADAESRRDFPDSDQRAAFCLSRFEQRGEKMANDYGLIRAVMDSIMKHVSKDEPADLQGQILKADDEQHIVFGWASVVTEKGEPVEDSQGDVIPPGEMERAANAFMQDVRTAKAMHAGEGVGEVIHSLPLTKSLADSLGIETPREGWIIAMKIHDDAVWQRVKSGELRAFSIGGTTQREAVD